MKNTDFGYKYYTYQCDGQHILLEVEVIENTSLLTVALEMIYKGRRANKPICNFLWQIFIPMSKAIQSAPL
jgi:hypothetical protein